MTKNRKNKIISYLILLLVISILIFLLGNKVNSEDVKRVVEQTGFWAPLIYILIFASTHIIAPLSGTPVFFAGYALFNSNVQFYTYFATLLSASVNFWISKKWGRGLVARIVGQKDMSKIDQFTEDYGVKSLIFLRMFQGHLVDFISYAYGLTNMNFGSYFIVTVLAPIPWLLLWQFYIFPRVENIRDFTVWFVLTLIPLFVISWLFFRYKRNNNKK